MPTHQDIVYTGGLNLVVMEEGSTAYTTQSHPPLAIRLEQDHSIIGLTEQSKKLIDRLDLNSVEEVECRKLKDMILATMTEQHPPLFRQIVNRFCSRMDEIACLNRQPSNGISGSNQKALSRLLYASVITVMEAFLADYLKALVSTDERALKNLLEQSPWSQGQGGKADELNDVTHIIDRKSFHNPKIINAFYSASLDRNIEIPISIETAVQVRHDIIHRGGNKIDEEHPLTVQRIEVSRLVNTIQEFVLSNILGQTL